MAVWLRTCVRIRKKPEPKVVTAIRQLNKFGWLDFDFSVSFTDSGPLGIKWAPKEHHMTKATPTGLRGPGR